MLSRLTSNLGLVFNNTSNINTIIASGGTEIVSEGYKYHVFITDDNFVLTTESASIDMIMIGGGGKGGGPRSSSGGGGSGGVLYQENRSITSGTYPFIIGLGATTSFILVEQSHGNSGNDTTAFGLTAIGGGGGNVAFYNRAPDAVLDGGSGGGGGVQYSQPGVGGSAQQSPSDGATGYGNPGGDGDTYDSIYTGGGGGGAGGAGIAGDNASTGGAGGNGQSFPIFPAPVLAPAIPAPVRSDWISAVGPTGIFAGGGGGGATSGGGESNAGDGGSGGGGAGGWNDSTAGTNAVQYTGSGGGAGAPSGNGGDGIVIIRYATS